MDKFSKVMEKVALVTATISFVGMLYCTYKIVSTTIVMRHNLGLDWLGH